MSLRSGHLGGLTSFAPGLLLSLWAVAQFAIHPLSQRFELEALKGSASPSVSVPYLPAASLAAAGTHSDSLGLMNIFCSS